MFAFGDALSDRIADQNSTADLKDESVYCDTIFVDFDDRPEEAKAMQGVLKRLGIGFCVYDSGGRSVHLHIKCKPIEGSWVPLAVKNWVRRMSNGKADLSFYHPSGMYRLPGTVHEKTGRIKHIIHQEKGALAYIMESDTKLFKTKVKLEQDEPPVKVAERLKKNLLTVKEEGYNRHQFVSVILAKDCIKLNVAEDEAVEMILSWNSLFCRPPLPEGEVEDRVKESYKKWK